MRATQRLISRGFEAYLVGGCVRDLLLDRTPKDYDIATEARPPQVKRTFPRNCRIIGRRFKLAHLYFNNNTKILEVSTFRRTPEVSNNEDDLLITRDNEFGNAEEDALRRDFTVNALFLDPTRNCILDYTNGLADLRARVIRTIGDPRVRFREDPVRILRAAKFAGRLGFSIEPETFAAMAETSGDLVRAAPPRLLEEILRLLRGGHALDSFQLLRDVGALKILVPVLAEFLAQARHDQRVNFWRLLEALDHSVLQSLQRRGRVPSNAVLLGTLFVGPVLAKAEANPGRSPSSIAEDLLGPLGQSLRLPRRDAGCLKRICGVQHRFTQTDESKRFRVAGFVQGPYFDEALELFELRMLGAGSSEADVQRWRELANGHTSHAPADEGDQPRDTDADDGPDDWQAESGVEDDGGEPGAEPAAAGEEFADDGGEASEPAAEAGEPAPSGAADEGGHGDRRRRRRRRRRGRGRGTEDGAEAHREGPATFPRDPDQPVDAAGDLVPTETQTTARSQPTPRPPRPVHVDFIHPEGAEPALPEAGSEPTDGDDAFVAPAFGEAPAETGEPGRRRRRRRRRRRGHRGDEAGGEHGRFPTSEPPAPHGEATDADTHHHALPGDAEVQRDPGAPAPEVPAAETAAAPGGDAAVEPHAASDSGAQGERRGRRRRRRGRGRLRDDAGRPGEPGHGGQAEARQAQPGGEPGRQERRQQQQPRHHQQQNQNQQQNRQSSRHDRQKERQERRDQRRRGGGHGAPRDVDVVPRYRDRRGKVDVIEPPPLDLSAFDVELDPKRVPTFGSIVEGKNRPKKRSPRVPEDGVDDYRPPPPPGSDSGPSAPPPPPPSDTPDTFGDW